MINGNGERFKTLARRVLEAAFAVLFLVLLYLNLRLRQRIASLEAALHEARKAAMEDSFHVGEIVSPMPVRTLDGKEFRLNPSLGHRNLMMLIIGSDCERCNTALDDVRNGEFKNRGLLIISASEKGIKELAEQRQIAGITYILLPTLSPQARMKFSHPPMVLLLTPIGRITRICDRPRGCV